MTVATQILPIDGHGKIVWEEPKSKELVQRVLFVMTGICAILSLIPPLRFGASLALRGVSMLSVSATKVSPTKPGLLLHLAKVSAVALGTIGLAASLAPLMMASLGVDMGMQLIQMGEAFANDDPMKGLLHLLFFTIDTFALVGMILGSWEFMVAAAAVSAFTMLIFAFWASVCARQSGNGVDRFFVFLSLMAVSIAGAVTTAELSRNASQVTVKNDDPNETVIVRLGRHGQGPEFTGEPGKDLVFDPKHYIGYEVVHQTSGGESWTEVCTVPREIIQDSLSPALFGTLPLSGPALTAAEQNIPNFRRGFSYD